MSLRDLSLYQCWNNPHHLPRKKQREIPEREIPWPRSIINQSIGIQTIVGQSHLPLPPLNRIRNQYPASQDVLTLA